MVQYSCLNPIAACGLDLFTDEYKKVDDMEASGYIVVLNEYAIRSAKKEEVTFK